MQNSFLRVLQTSLIISAWAANKSESSKKAQLRKDINQTIRIVSTYSEFLAFMEAKHLNSNKLQEQIADLISRKESLNTQYVSFKQEIKELELIHQNLSKYLKQDAPEIQRSSHNKLPSL